MYISGNMKKYRYILTGRTGPDEFICNFRLIAPQIVTKQWSGCCSRVSDAIRVDVTNLNIKHYSCDTYSTVEDDIALRDLDPKIFFRKNDKWQEDKSLTEKWLKGEIPNNDIRDYLTSNGLYSSLQGYYTKDAYFEFRARKGKEEGEKECLRKGN